MDEVDETEMSTIDEETEESAYDALMTSENAQSIVVHFKDF